ncbi:MAG TPA: biliverdin-producing heme oxygenase [Kofleriaceae bacterium]|jgi:heme oxygenase
MSSWMIGRLHQETRAHHADSDADCDILFRADTGPGDYLLYLVRQYGFEAPLESVLSLTPGLELLVSLKERAKAGFIAADLLALGLRPQEVAELPMCMQLPSFRGAAEALGWMYVVERATLAHNVLRHHLETRIPRELPSAHSYLSCYQSVVGTRWRQFGQALDAIARTTAIADRMIEASHDAFRCQRRWMRQELNVLRRATA